MLREKNKVGLTFANKSFTYLKCGEIFHCNLFLFIWCYKLPFFLTGKYISLVKLFIRIAWVYANRIIMYTNFTDNLQTCLAEF